MFLIESIPAEYRERAVKTAAALSGIDDVLIAAHIHPDGDALGSMAAVGWMMQRAGKRQVIYAPTGIPENLHFLDLPGATCHSLPSVNIDHHLGSSGMGSVANFVESSAAATAQLVAYVIAASGQKLEGPVGRAVGLGLMTDTGGFCHGNTTADVFELCANLSRNGCDFAHMRENLQKTWTLGRMHLWGRIFTRASLELNDCLVICVVTRADLAEFSCSRDDVEGVVEWLRRLRKARIAAIIREDGRKLCKFSLRSFGDDDVRAIAAALGGGGHRNAAGGTLSASPEEAKKCLLEAVEQIGVCGCR